MAVTLLWLLCPLLTSDEKQGKQQINYVLKKLTSHCTGCRVADWITLQFERQVTGRHLTLVKQFEKADQSCHTVLLMMLDARGDDTKEFLITPVWTFPGEPYKVGGPAS